MKILLSLLLCQVLLPTAVECFSCLLAGNEAISLPAVQGIVSDYSFTQRGQVCRWTLTTPSYTDVLLRFNINDVLSSNTCGTGNHLALHGNITNVCSDSNGKCFMYARSSIPASCQGYIAAQNCSVTVLNDWNPRINYYKFGTEQPAGFSLFYLFINCADLETQPIPPDTVPVTTTTNSMPVATSNGTGVTETNINTTTTNATVMNSSQLSIILPVILVVVLFILGLVAFFLYKRFKSKIGHSDELAKGNKPKSTIQANSVATEEFSERKSIEYEEDPAQTYTIMKPSPAYGAVYNTIENPNEDDDDEFSSDEDSDDDGHPAPGAIYTQVIKKKKDA